MLGADLPEKSGATTSTPRETMARTTSLDGKQSWEVPLAPFLGCLGVAPAAAKCASTIVPDPFGGNMDCPEVRAGNTVFLGVNVPGALLSFGDGHYAMGDGEIIGTAIEGAMNVEVSVDLIKGRATPGRASRTQTSDDRRRGPPARRRGARRVQGDGRLGRATRSGSPRWTRTNSSRRTPEAPIVEMVDPEYTVLVRLSRARVPRR